MKLCKVQWSQVFVYMGKIAVCPRCEKIYKISTGVKEAWCQHYIPNRDGSPDYRYPLEKVECKIAEQK